MSSQQDQAESAPAVPNGDAASPDFSNSVSPETTPALGRLFVVPALIVCVLLGVAVVVVLFGTSSVEKGVTLDELITRIESDSGERTMGIALFPAAKESWQAAQELARRLAAPDALPAEEVEPVATRIIGIVRRLVAESGPQDAANASASQGRARSQFLITSLGFLKTPIVVEPLLEVLDDEDPHNRLAAVLALAKLEDLPEAREALPRLYKCLDDDQTSVQMVGCLAIACLAESGDAVAERNLARKLHGDVEVQWNAATALAHLGSSRGYLVLMNMLDRKFWENIELDYDEEGSRVQRTFSQDEVSQRLLAAVQAAANLDEPGLWEQIRKLRAEDISVHVREAARLAIEAGTENRDEEQGARGLSDKMANTADTSEVS